MCLFLAPINAHKHYSHHCVCREKPTFAEAQEKVAEFLQQALGDSLDKAAAAAGAAAPGSDAQVELQNDTIKTKHPDLHNACFRHDWNSKYNATWDTRKNTTTEMAKISLIHSTESWQKWQKTKEEQGNRTSVGGIAMSAHNQSAMGHMERSRLFAYRMKREREQL